MPDLEDTNLTEAPRVNVPDPEDTNLTEATRVNVPDPDDENTCLNNSSTGRPSNAAAFCAAPGLANCALLF